MRARGELGNIPRCKSTTWGIFPTLKFDMSGEPRMSLYFRLVIHAAALTFSQNSELDFLCFQRVGPITDALHFGGRNCWHGYRCKGLEPDCYLSNGSFSGELEE
ncbi:hypothetical protein A1355_13895 [Methylomonas koyamae]|uniref:Uncharacterized protein n=1 Tax=Methylomonas koyamae TaxID=702114 RepID=A0A177N6V2_9GAMM|nr:hypothetical protein A1355_13895 [Methylomonas koyamae]